MYRFSSREQLNNSLSSASASARSGIGAGPVRTACSTAESMKGSFHCSLPFYPIVLILRNSAACVEQSTIPCSASALLHLSVLRAGLARHLAAGLQGENRISRAGVREQVLLVKSQRRSKPPAAD